MKKSYKIKLTQYEELLGSIDSSVNKPKEVFKVSLDLRFTLIKTIPSNFNQTKESLKLLNARDL